MKGYIYDFLSIISNKFSNIVGGGGQYLTAVLDSIWEYIGHMLDDMHAFNNLGILLLSAWILLLLFTTPTHTRKAICNTGRYSISSNTIKYVDMMQVVYHQYQILETPCLGCARPTRPYRSPWLFSPTVVFHSGTMPYSIYRVWRFFLYPGSQNRDAHGAYNQWLQPDQ